MSGVVEANDQWVLATLKIDPVVLRTLPNGGSPPQQEDSGGRGGRTDPTPQAGTGDATPVIDLGLDSGGGGPGTVFGQGSGGLNTGQGLGSGRGPGGTGTFFGQGSGMGNGGLNTGLGLGSGSGPGGPGTVFGQGAGTESDDTARRLLAGGNPGTGPGNTSFTEPNLQGTDTGSGSGPVTGSSQGVSGTPQLGKEQLKQAMLDKMPVSTKTPEWAKGIDMKQARLGKEIKSGSFGTTAWVDGVGEESLVIKTGKLNDDHAQVLANCADLAHEAEFYEKIGEHPNIAKCMGIQEIQGQRGLVLEGIRGKDMHATMDRLEKLRLGDKKEMAKLGRSTPLSQSEFVGMQQFMLTETLKGLAKLEESGVVHGDIRPDNIMVDSKTGGIKLVDLGIAFDSGTRPKIAPIGHGSVGPEYTRPGGMTAKFDVFSAGEIAHKGFERDQFRYGNDGPVTMQGFAEFGKLDPSGNPLHQALNPQTAPVSTKSKDDYAGRLKDAQKRARELRGDNFVQTDTIGNSVISGDHDVTTQIEDGVELCKQKLEAYEKVKGGGGGDEALQAGEALDKALSELERRLAQTKSTGTFGVETEYTRFVNWAMNPDPTKRPSAQEALAHPFLADALLDEDSARTLMKQVLSDT